MASGRGRAPGRLDLLGGVADYSGALVLEIPTRQSTEVVATPAETLLVGPAELTVAETARLAHLPYPQTRLALKHFPRWTHYVLGVVLVLVRHGVIVPPRARLTVTSDLPASVGVASSAALEVATARALGADVHPLRLAALCQEAENHVVGAPCGIMDQVAVAAGAPDAVLPVMCRPASLRQPVPLPPGLEVVGWPSGAEHDVSGTPYARTRAAAFMGKRMVEQSAGRAWRWVSELPAGALTRLPDEVTGDEFLSRWGRTGDDLTTVDPHETYPVRAATSFGVEENARSESALVALRRSRHDLLGGLMAASDSAYAAMGLGHPASASVVAEAVSRCGVHGARSSGGGCGGTVVVACDRGALDDVEGLIR
jgi:L-arabinokinase